MQGGALLPSVSQVSGGMGLPLPAPQPAAMAGAPHDPNLGQPDGDEGSLLQVQQIDAMPGLSNGQQVTFSSFVVLMARPVLVLLCGQLWHCNSFRLTTCCARRWECASAACTCCSTSGQSALMFSGND